nr:substrate-binding domain-containing protein [uncultured Rhodopila sp.]
MPFLRRGLLATAPAAALSLIITPASAATTDLAVSCDTAAASAVIRAGDVYRSRTGVRIRVFPTSPGLLLPQLEREIQNDIVLTQIAVLDQAEKEGLIQPGGRVGPWRNRLVIATSRDTDGPEGSFAVTDPTPASGIDGPAILQRLGAMPKTVLGVINTGTVAWLLTNGQAQQGLLHQTEIVNDSSLKPLSAVPDDVWPPILYAATVTKLARRGDPAAFVAFLGGPDGQAVLHLAGLESAS